MASSEYAWLQQQGNQLAALYPQQWIAVDGEAIPNDSDNMPLDPRRLPSPVVAHGNSLEDVFQSLNSLNLSYAPLDLFYAFIRTPMENHLRQEK